ncbi:receptor-like protein 33 [Rhododendron vialii]|uniref:receptor-like protein 33 n=1 Tax=Rhododendron vialii TaxID=182163 RepID=UPI00265FDF65|nr:receptor-like protein 33 [Rhododendron vialii]
MVVMHNQISITCEFETITCTFFEDIVTIITKGLEMELVMILTIFTALDFSNNRFKEEIPDIAGDLKYLYVLNLSRYAFTGSIPSSLGSLSRIESLDLSWNKLSGSIPVTLASLTFLLFMNLAYNQLIGMIPSSTQLQSFPETSFEETKAYAELLRQLVARKENRQRQHLMVGMRMTLTEST